MFTSIEEIKAANKAIGHHFFDKSTTRFFNDRVFSEVWPLKDGGAVFIHSIQPTDGERTYKVRRILPDGVVSVTRIDHFSTLAAAKKAAEFWANQINKEA